MMAAEGIEWDFMIANKGRVVTSHLGVEGGREKPLVIPCPFTAEKGHYSSPTIA